MEEFDESCGIRVGMAESDMETAGLETDEEHGIWGFTHHMRRDGHSYGFPGDGKVRALSSVCERCVKGRRAKTGLRKACESHKQR